MNALPFSFPPRFLQASSLGALLLTSALFSGCATLQPDVEVKSEIITPLHPPARSVAVVTLDNATKSATTERLAELVSQELATQGFQVKATPEEADLVVMATFSRTTEADDPSLAVDRTSWESDPLRNSPLSFGSRDMSSSGSLSAMDVTTPAPRAKAGIIVTAMPRSSWLTSRGDGSAVKTWRVIAIMTQYNTPDDILAQLVQGCGPTFKSLAHTP